MTSFDFQLVATSARVTVPVIVHDSNDNNIHTYIHTYIPLINFRTL